ncbi:hypothetical protein BGZ83_001429 [Gryganskiella cystojenkinii]|nr:hypothetical protein BGZ83_001429 [Gryganskiella cystojenkinii]
MNSTSSSTNNEHLLATSSGYNSLPPSLDKKPSSDSTSTPVSASSIGGGNNTERGFGPGVDPAPSSFGPVDEATKGHAAAGAGGMPMPSVHESFEELMAMHPHGLIQMLDVRQIDHTGCIEKDELVRLIVDKCTVGHH